MLALTVAAAKNLAIVVVLVLIAAAFLTAKLVANVTKKAVLLLVVGALALGVWKQRANVSECADSVKSTLGQTETVCTFFGKDVTIPGR